ncbi:SubName: Full=Uncharacterized protein {ECO:0000313/EMBL:CCA70030.1} [Serendipita indica DSM 11827]|uniref:F-box domain-containing protein n=1 Tax=Serendipita indica (strain DSM 11827) TaxID=1109443 RepID=G4TFD2_SERID|nr:SubName: Full=Uncharacterized protein {ECO:0000313/EMBL:CCA70030.1} [Serendipita indica DSM 11827]CCA70030.1 hypothetical protein PIIN_03970 [Serendipita indica DSM 11827]
MSRWRAAPPSSMECDPPSTTGPTRYPLRHGAPRPSPFSLAAYQLVPSSNEHNFTYGRGMHSRSSSWSSFQVPNLHLPPSHPSPTAYTNFIGQRSQSPTLPVELYRLIVAYVPSAHDLCTLARVSRSFQAEAERVLYHTLHLRHHIKTIAQCQRLAGQPRLARYVRRLSIIIDQYTPLEYISNALAACSNLRSLTLRGAPWSDYTKVLDAVCSTRIREFTCHARGEAGVVRFLERQTELEQVDLEAQSFDFESLSPLAARKLWSFTGCLTTAAAIVPSRPIRRLTLTSDLANDATVRAVEKLSLGLGDVEALDIRMGVLRNPMSWSILESVFISLRGLRFLGVCSLDCARHPSFPYYIMGLPNLQTIVFGTGTDDYVKYDERVQLELVIISLSVWKHDWIWTRDISHVADWNSITANGGTGASEWWGMVSHEPINLEELAKLHVDIPTSPPTP